MDALCSQKHANSLYLFSYVLGIETSCVGHFVVHAYFHFVLLFLTRNSGVFKTFVASLMSVDPNVVVADRVLTEILYNVFSETFTLMQRYRDFVRKILEAGGMC